MPPQRKKGGAKPNQYTANQLFTGFMVVTMCFLVFAMWPEWSETRGLDSMLARMGVRRGRVEVKCTGYGDERSCSLYTKRTVDRGEKMFQIPQSYVMQGQTIAQEPELKDVLSFESESLRAAMQAVGLPLEYFWPSFTVFFKLWHEMKLGSRSELYQWIELMPKKPNHGLYFTEGELECLDKTTGGEVNSTRTFALNFGKVVQDLCKEHTSLYSCSYFDESKIEEESIWAFATLQQRTWGEFRSPMLIPLVDFAFQHPDLCNPEVDKDERCVGRDKQYFLLPHQEEGDSMLQFRSNFQSLAGEKIYTTSHNRAPWDTLITYGYADHAASVIPDLLFSTRFQKYVQENKLDLHSKTDDHPLKKCLNRNQMVWRETGLHSPELRACWASLHYFTEHPEHLSYDEEAREAWNAYFEDPINKLKSKYIAQRSLVQSAQQLSMFITQGLFGNIPEACQADEGRLPVIKKTYDLTGAFFQRIVAKGLERQTEAFDRWAAKDSTADRSVEEPKAPEKAEAEAETVEGDDAGVTEDETADIQE